MAEYMMWFYSCIKYNFIHGLNVYKLYYAWRAWSKKLVTFGPEICTCKMQWHKFYSWRSGGWQCDHVDELQLMLSNKSLSLLQKCIWPLTLGQEFPFLSWYLSFNLPSWLKFCNFKLRVTASAVLLCPISVMGVKGAFWNSEGNTLVSAVEVQYKKKLPLLLKDEKLSSRFNKIITLKIIQ